MAESQNPLLNELCAGGAAQSLRLRIRLEGPAPCSAPAPDGDQCMKRTLNACKCSKRKRIVDNGIQTSSDAKRVAQSANIPELSSNTFLSSEQETKCGVGSNYTEAIQHKPFNGDTLCRLMRCDTATEGRKRSHSSLGLLTSSRFKQTNRSSSAERSASSIDDLPDVVLVEILCRLPCNKMIFQCKCVSKRWRTLITDPYFIGRFVNIQTCKQTPKVRTLIHRRGKEFPPKLSSSPNLLTPVLIRIESFHPLIAEPVVVVATYNDLVLCCASEGYQHYYYICNAYTRQCVALPPTPIRSLVTIPVGFICDFPDLNCMKDGRKGHNIQLDAECRSVIVRILPPGKFANDKKCNSFKLNVEIFSSETGEWRNSVVPSPQYFDFDYLENFSFAYDGMLYWPGAGLSLIGLGPFFDNYRTSSNSSSNGDGIVDHKLRFTVFKEPVDRGFLALHLSVFGGCVRMCNLRMATLYVWELKEQDDDRIVDGASEKFCLNKRMVYPLDRKMYPDKPKFYRMEAFDPNNKDILYVRVDRDIIKCNILTGEWSKIVENDPLGSYHCFPVELPWWPTPVPRLTQQHTHGEGASS